MQRFNKKLILIFGGVVFLGALSLVLSCSGGNEKEGGSAPEKQEPGPGGKGFGPGRGHGPGMMMGKMPEFEPLPVTEEQAKEPVTDPRILVKMPGEQRTILRGQMKQFLVSLMQLQMMLNEGQFKEAANLAETTMGRTERGQHRGKGPGLYMPIPMRTLAWGMHDSASEFAETAEKGDLKASYQALQKLQASCVSCHLTYHTW